MLYYAWLHLALSTAEDDSGNGYLLGHTVGLRSSDAAHGPSKASTGHGVMFGQRQETPQDACLSSAPRWPLRKSKTWLFEFVEIRQTRVNVTFKNVNISQQTQDVTSGPVFIKYGRNFKMLTLNSVLWSLLVIISSGNIYSFSQSAAL